MDLRNWTDGRGSVEIISEHPDQLSVCKNQLLRVSVVVVAVGSCSYRPAEAAFFCFKLFGWADQRTWKLGKVGEILRFFFVFAKWVSLHEPLNDREYYYRIWIPGVHDYQVMKCCSSLATRKYRKYEELLKTHSLFVTYRPVLHYFMVYWTTMFSHSEDQAFISIVIPYKRKHQHSSMDGNLGW